MCLTEPVLERLSPLNSQGASFLGVAARLERLAVTEKAGGKFAPKREPLSRSVRTWQVCCLGLPSSPAPALRLF